MNKKVLGIGNALVDLLINIDSDTFLNDFNLPKGSMTLINREKMEAILNRIASSRMEMQRASGGSVANTIHGLSQLGGIAGYIGKTGKDDYGSFFCSYMEQNNICATLFNGTVDTGKSIIMVSPDSERTFATYLGAAVELNALDLTQSNYMGYDYFHLEGYLVQNYELVEKALELANNAGCGISIDLASYNIVRENIDFLQRIVEKYVDIVFANEEEARVFTGKNDPESALDSIASLCSIAIVKIGKEGSLIREKDKKFRIAPIKAIPKDTTGAGDLYASGFFYGLTSGQSLDICGKIGSIVSAKIIEVVGAKMGPDRWDEVKRSIGAIV